MYSKLNKFCDGYNKFLVGQESSGIYVCTLSVNNSSMLSLADYYAKQKHPGYKKSARPIRRIGMCDGPN